jgi:beta-aspartyl-peptidase (threonine type)
MQGGTALDAVEKVVNSMEDNPSFNAGHGAVLNEIGQVECDAMIMDGSTLSSGQLSAPRNIAGFVNFYACI